MPPKLDLDASVFAPLDFEADLFCTKTPTRDRVMSHGTSAPSAGDDRHSHDRSNAVSLHLKPRDDRAARRHARASELRPLWPPIVENEPLDVEKALDEAFEAADQFALSFGRSNKTGKKL